MRNGAAFLHIESIGVPFNVDPGRLQLRWNGRGAADVAIGNARPVDMHQAATGMGPRIYAYEAPITFNAAPQAPGMYELDVSASPGFAVTGSGEDLPLSDSPGTHESVWWPDEAHGDAALSQLRQRFSGRTIYAYGGAWVGCSGAGNIYGPETPLHVLSIQRKREVRLLGTGTSAIGLPDTTFSFLAIDPISLLLEPAPGSKPRAMAGSSNPESPCLPQIHVADVWQADVTFTTSTPPPGIETPIRVGTTREHVLWADGYPNVYGTAADFAQMSTWSYTMPAPFAWSVTFKGDRVVKYNEPGNLP